MKKKMKEDYSKMDTKTLNNIMKLYFEKNRIISHQIDSFNEFINVKIPQIINQYNPVTIYHNFNEDINNFEYEVFLYFENFKILLPVLNENNGEQKILTPNDARSRSISYSSTMFIDLRIEYRKRFKKDHQEGEDDDDEKIITYEKKITNISLGKLPIMIKSDLCLTSKTKYNDLTDIGGYFIINGNEKVIITQERTAENKVLIFKRKKSSTVLVAEVKSSSYEKFLPTKHIQLKIVKKKENFLFTISMPNLKSDIPLMEFLYCLGLKSDLHLIKILSIFTDKLSDKELSILNYSFKNNKSRDKNESKVNIFKYTNITGTPKELLTNNKRIISFIDKFISRNFIPHVKDQPENKLMYTIHILSRLLSVYYNKANYDDRDSYFNKRLDTTGTLLSYIFRMNYTKMLKDTRNSVIKELNNSLWKKEFDITNLINYTNIYKIIKSTTIETGIKYSLATGNWGQKIINNKMGIAQVLSRLNTISTLSHLRRVCSPVEKTGKIVLPRKLHTSQWGYICPVETPEGASIGIVKNLSLGTIVTRYIESNVIKLFIQKLDKFILTDDLYIDILKNLNSLKNEYSTYIKIFINGELYGIIDIAIFDLFKILRDKKINGVFPIYTGIVKNISQNTINIWTSGGRCCRPLFIYNNNKLNLNKNFKSLINKKKVNWINLLIPNLLLKKNVQDNFNLDDEKQKHQNQQNTLSYNEIVMCKSYDSSKRNNKPLIELIDQQEQNNILVNTLYITRKKNLKNTKNNKYTHSEIHFSLIIGITASTVPFINHNQSPRNTYQAAMCKQAMGIYSLNFRNRFDTLSYVLYYPQKPIVAPKITNILNLNQTPFGMNCIVAIASYTGYNQEDSILINKSSLDRGLFRATYYKTYKDEELRDAIGIEKFNKPSSDNTFYMKPSNYNKLNKEGLVPINTYIKEDDIIIGKTFPLKKTNTSNIQYYQDCSTVLKKNEEGYIDNIYKNKNGEGYNFVKIKIRINRIPTIGDKFSSRYGQKGTVGNIYEAVDMPFSSHGYKPDLIINPHAIPSRMTIGQLIESVLSKASVIQGKYSDSSPFININSENIYEVLKENGFEEYGDDELYNGITGKKMKTKIFICPTYYQRLKHMVKNKIHSRTSGPVVMMTRQPAEGRTRDGGLRFGEMEKDCMLSHGNTQFLKEKFIECSDKFNMLVCGNCGNFCYINNYINDIRCNVCNNFRNFNPISLPYATKLLFQEMQSMGISPKLKFK